MEKKNKRINNSGSTSPPPKKKKEKKKRSHTPKKRNLELLLRKLQPVNFSPLFNFFPQETVISVPQLQVVDERTKKRM